MIFDDDPGGQVSRNQVTISAVILPLAKDLLWPVNLSLGCQRIGKPRFFVHRFSE
jgi:hypothetical protein